MTSSQRQPMFLGERVETGEEEEEDCKVIEPLVKHHKGPEHDPEGGSGGGSSLFAVFGP